MPANSLATFYENLIHSAELLVIVLICYFLATFLLTRRMDSSRRKRQCRIRSLYIALIIFLLFMARIWVEGFMHLFAMLALVSAALVVTNKESIMNLVGWLIINWRGLFTEDDLIQIQQYRGYVKSMGVLYFTLYEVSSEFSTDITGKTIRVPNGLIANNALINFYQTCHLLEQKMTIVVVQDSDINQAMTVFQNLIDSVLASFYEHKNEFNMTYLRKRIKNVDNKLNLQAKVSLRLKSDKPAGVELTARYYCFSEDMESVQQQISLKLLDDIKNDSVIKLSNAV